MASSTLVDWDLYDEDAMDFEVPERPTTPTPPSRSKLQRVAVDDPANQDDKVASTLGRTPSRVRDILDEGFPGIHSDFNDLAERTGLAFHQVIDRFMQRFNRTCSSNLWNSYEKFHAANKDQEIARIKQLDTTTSQPGVLCSCRVIC